MSKHHLIIAAVTGLSLACGMVEGDPRNSTGTQTIESDFYTQNFDASVAQASVKSVPLTNNTSKPITLQSAAFANNLCGSFSFHNVTDSSGKVLSTEVSSLGVKLAPGASVNLNIQFEPKPCPQKNYDTKLTVWLLNSDSKYEKQEFLLHSACTSPSPAMCQTPGATANSSSEENATCGQDPRQLEYEEQYLSSVPAAGEYYFRIDRMASFILPLDPGASGQRNIVGTDVGSVDPAAFKSPFLQASVKEKGVFDFNKITSCDYFAIPSASGDANFQGAEVKLTTKDKIAGVLERNPQRTTEINIKGLTVNLRGDDIKKDSLIEKDGVFQVSVKLDLTTGETEPDIHLGEDLKTTPNFSEQVFNRVDKGEGKFALKGRPMADGSFTLVGVGEFNNNDKNFIGDDLAKQFIIDKKAMIYVQMDVTLTKRVEGTAP